SRRGHRLPRPRTRPCDAAASARRLRSNRSGASVPRSDGLEHGRGANVSRVRFPLSEDDLPRSGCEADRVANQPCRGWDLTHLIRRIPFDGDKAQECNVESRIYQHTLPNGLVLLAERMEHVRSAAFNFLVPAGCANDPEGKLGVASILAEVITRGA